MKTIVGIDIGGSTTKISGFVGKNLLKCIQVEASNPIASLFGAFGQFLTENELDLSDIAEIHLTGVGSSGVTKPIYGIPTYKVDEFVANGVGGRFFAKEEKSVVVSMGTGTSYVLVEGDKLTHLGGIAIGGGTILGLSKLLLNTQDVDAIQALSSQGDYKQIDLLIGDISKQPLPGLNLNVTAANFGKVEEMVSKEDIAAGIVHMVIENLCHTGTLIAHNMGVKEFILIGSLANFAECDFITKDCAELAGEGVYFVIPEHAGFATSIGAALVTARECSPVTV
ncbi:MAG: type II pantothenate kinase [Lachnospiraceae bacterium]|nr:type II pantothenate kinase [Lachnospiraceae bacterium]